MRWLYRLQQRLAVTRHEAFAVLVLAGLFLLGLGARYLQGRPEPLPPDAYAEADRLFAEGTATLAPLPVADTLHPVAPPVSPPAAALVAPARLDLNAATAAELERLPRVGPKTALRIVEHRARYGSFRQVRDLLQVRGIGEKTLARLEPYLYVE